MHYHQSVNQSNVESNPKVARPIRTSSPRLASSPEQNPPRQREKESHPRPSVAFRVSWFLSFLSTSTTEKRHQDLFSSSHRCRCRCRYAVTLGHCNIPSVDKIRLISLLGNSPFCPYSIASTTYLIDTACLSTDLRTKEIKHKDKKALIDPASLLCVARPTTPRLREINPL